MTVVKKYFRMWLFGLIIFITVEYCHQFQEYSKQNFNHYVNDLIGLIIIVLFPLFLFKLAQGADNFLMKKDDNLIFTKNKWIIISAIIVGCIALVAIAFIAPKSQR